MATCRLCDGAVKANGLCAKHYMRQRRTGDPNQVGKAGRPRPRVEPYVVNSTRAAQRANAAHRRLVNLTATMDGFRVVMQDFGVQRALAAATEADKRAWVQSLSSVIPVLARLRDTIADDIEQ